MLIPQKVNPTPYSLLLVSQKQELSETKLLWSSYTGAANSLKLGEYKLSFLVIQHLSYDGYLPS